MRLLTLAASGLLPLVLVLAWGINHLIEERQQQAERSAQDISRALATAVSSEHRSIEVLLDHLGRSDDLERADFRGFQIVARRAVADLKWVSIVLTDAEGRTLMRTGEPIGESDPAAREPESLKEVLQKSAPAVSHVFTPPGAGADTFVVRVPVMRGGKLVYVLSANIPIALVADVMARQNIPHGSVASVFDQRQYRVEGSRQTASPYPHESLKALLDRGEPQGVGRTTTREGTENYTGYTRLPGSGWIVVVGNSVAEANKGLYALLRAVALGFVASLALAALLAWVLSRSVFGPIDVLTNAAADLGRGKPVQVPPLEIQELDDVGHALNEAAAERDRAAARVADALHVAEDANRSKDQFLAMLGHELRNPLAPIANAVQIMALKGDEKTAQERHVIERQLVHVTRLVDDLLDVSRITSGRLNIRREPMRIAQVLAQLVDTLNLSVYHHQLALQLDASMDSAWVAGDETRLAQVFNNLLVNAVKFTPSGGSIDVHASLVDGEVRVQVRDSGIGMSQQDLDRVFDLFYQAPQNADRSRGGLGLGLPIVKSLVGMHGGRVHAASTGPGQGSTLTVHLPLCQAPVSPGVAEALPSEQGSGNVLVVDDNEDAADTCAALLELSGYVVRTAYTPQAALEALRESGADVAILDIGLPGMSGYALAMLMKNSGYRGALVALTGYGQAADMANSRAAGFDAHLTKPVSPAALLDLVSQMMKARADSAA